MNPSIIEYNQRLEPNHQSLVELLASIINHELGDAESKIWHAHPVWFLNGNPIVGYHKLKSGIRLLFWSGQSFNEEKLKGSGKFKAAEITFNAIDEIQEEEISSWLKKSREIQWDYKNIVKRKGKLERLL